MVAVRVVVNAIWLAENQAFVWKRDAEQRESDVGSRPVTVRERRTRMGVNALLLLVLSGLISYFASDIRSRAQGTDFPDRYSAARMVLEGEGHRLYDFRVQQQFQTRYAGRIGEYYIHPPFETLLFLPLCLWPLPTAYLIWCSLNAGVLACTAILFQRHILKGLDWRVLLPLFFVFPPVLISFLQGQDSLLLLLSMTLAVVALRRRTNFAAGCWLACGLFKFHIVLVVFVLLLGFRKRGFLSGFSLVAVFLVLLSLAVSGWGVLAAYPRFLVTLSGLPLANLHPAGMPNLRGLIDSSGLFENAVFRLVAVAVASAALFWYASSRFRREGTRLDDRASADPLNLAFGNFVLAAILLSYHLSPSDLSIALLPLALFFEHRAEHSRISHWASLSVWITGGVLLLPPLHLLALSTHQYVLLAIPLLILFLLSSSASFAGGEPGRGGGQEFG